MQLKAFKRRSSRQKVKSNASGLQVSRVDDYCPLPCFCCYCRLCKGRGGEVEGWRGFSKSVTQVSIILFAVVLLLLLLIASSVHGLHPGQQQRQVDAEARHVLVRVVLRRVEALRLGQEIFGDVQVQETVL